MKLDLLTHHRARSSSVSMMFLTSLISLACFVSACVAQSPTPPDQSVQAQLKRALRKGRAKLESTARDLLSPLEYKVAFESGTERAFQNRYWDNKKSGIYVDLVSGKPLFSSAHKFKSGTGWPSFDRALSKLEVVEVVDKSHGMTRVEVRSKTSDIHLGHVFEDGPRKTTGRRFCINSAALRFIPRSEMKAAGYGSWIKKAGL